MPFSPLRALLGVTVPRALQWREKTPLIFFQRIEKSASPAGSVQTAWMWSGSTTIASQVTGCPAVTEA